MTRFLVLFMVFVLTASPANALEINADGANKIQKIFQDLLDYQKTINEAFGSVDVDYEGEVTVAQETDYYAVTLPRILLKTPEYIVKEEPEQESTFDLGVIKINAMPDEKDGYWKTVWTFPSEMKLSDKNNKPFVISYTGQNTVALINEKLGYFTKMNANFSNMHFKEDGKDIGINLGNIQLYTNFEEEGDARYSGPFKLTIANLSAEDPEAADHIKIGELKIDGKMEGLVLPTLAEYQEQLLKHKEVFEGLTTAETPEEMKKVGGENISDMLFDMYSYDMSGFDFQYSLKDLDLKSTKASNDGMVADNFTLGEAHLGFWFDDLNQEKGSMKIKLGYDGLSVSDEDEEFKSFVPQTMGFDIAFEKIPFPALTETAKNAVTSMSQSPEVAQMAGLGLMMRLPAILAQAESQITVKDNTAKNEIYDINLNGKVVSDLTAIMGFTAKFKTIFEGLDAVLLAAKDNPGNEGMVQQLTQIKETSESTTGPNGKQAYAITFEATPEGVLLLNGQDLSNFNTPTAVTVE